MFKKGDRVVTTVDYGEPTEWCYLPKGSTGVVHIGNDDGIDIVVVNTDEAWPRYLMRAAWLKLIDSKSVSDGLDEPDFDETKGDF